MVFKRVHFPRAIGIGRAKERDVNEKLGFGGRRPRVAALCTVYRPRSHADVIVSKLLADYTHPHPAGGPHPDYDGTVRTLTEAPLPVDDRGIIRRPRVDVVSLYIDQFPENDIARAWSETTGVPIWPTIEAALMRGGTTVSVDGVLIIGEHGDYPLNERGQRLYPRRAWFDQVANVLEREGANIPIFIDKHLGVGWDDASHIVQRAHGLGIPIMAGSSVSTAPLHWRSPRIDLPLGARVQRAVVVSPPPLEAYGFHALEALQSVVERRAGGETGVATVQCLVAGNAWKAMVEGAFDGTLLDAALAVCERATRGDVTLLAPNAAVFQVHYRDGLHATVVIPDEVTPQWAIALDYLDDRDQAQRIAFRFGMGDREPFSHFAWLLERIQPMFEGSSPTEPIERTLLTTGILDSVMASHEAGGTRVDTPHLDVAYRPGSICRD